MFGCSFQLPTSASACSSAPTTTAFNFSSTPSYSFSNFPPQSQTSQPGQSSTFTFRKRPLEVGLGTNPSQTCSPGAQTSTPTLQICPSCGHTSFWGQHWGSRVAAYTPTPDPDADKAMCGNPSAMFVSVSAMYVYTSKSHEELRWEDYRSRGKTGEQVAPFGESATFGQPMLAVPVLVFQVMPTFAFGGSGAIPWTPALGSSFGSYPSTHSGTPLAAFAAPPIVVGAPCVHGPVFGQSSVSATCSIPVIPAIIPLCEMLRQL